MGTQPNETGRLTGFFVQLVPMLAERTVMLVVAKADEEHLSVSVIPKKMKDGENAALLTPLCCTGTAEELDRELPGQLRQFVAGHVALAHNLAEIEREREQAEKAAREEARKKQRTASAGKDPAKTTPAPARPAETGPLLSLFDQQEATTPADPVEPVAK